MDELSNTVKIALVKAFEGFAARVHALSENLTDEQFWRKPYPYGNSFGHLTLHLTGNLNYYLGAQIAGSGYVRDRDREFTDQAPPSKEVALRRLDEVVALVVRTLEAQTPESWSTRYEGTGAGDSVKNRFDMFLGCATHFHHHVGQLIYLAKELEE